jgi:membrane protein implicated in regulation of membrane protease activity
VNGFTLAAFLCWFGGCGFLLERYANFLTPIVLGVATITGVIGAAILFWFLARVLLPHEQELTAEDTAVLGVLGRVSGAIREGGVGEIQFSQNGARRFAIARSEAGVAIPRGVEVVVMRYEQGIAWVRRWDEVAEDVTSIERDNEYPTSENPDVGHPASTK